MALAKAKGRFDSLPEADFEGLMRVLDLYRGLRDILRERYGMPVVTNATLKMYELLSQLSLLPCGPEDLPRSPCRVFCNAELPGAFLVAINHWVKTMTPGAALAQTATAAGRVEPAPSLDWVASSFYPGETKEGNPPSGGLAREDGASSAPAPKGEGAAGPSPPASDRPPAALGDQYGLYAANRGRWLMGPPPNALPPGAPPTTGDLTSAGAVAALAAAVHARWPGGAALYTSDAGTDVSGDYNHQEDLTALLNYGQVVCGLLSLARGGNLVTKQYTFFRPFSRSLAALLAALFDEALVVKPRTSRPVNSEVYLVGRGFRGLPEGLGAALLARLAAYREVGAPAPGEGAPLLRPEIGGAVDAALLRIAGRLWGRQQVAFLEEAADLYAAWRSRLPLLERALHRDASQVQATWLAENPVRPLPASQRLAQGRARGLAGRRPARGGRGGRGGPGRPRRAGRGGPPR